MENSNPTQCARVLEYMERHGGITPLEAMMELGVYRLASRISEMRKRGINIVDEWVKVTNRWNETCRIKRYRLGGDTNGEETRRDDLLRNGAGHQRA